MNEEQYKGLCRLSLYGLIVLLAMMFAVCMASCRQVRYVPVETVRTDSIAIHDTTWQISLVPYRDSVTVLPPDTASYLANPYAYSYAVYSGGILRHSLVIWANRTVTIRLPYFIDRYVRIYEPKVVEVERKLTKWQRICMEAGKALLLGIVPFGMIIVGWLVYKRMKK